MGRYSFAVIALWIIGDMLTGCGTFGKPVEELQVVEGQIDNVIYSEIADKKEFLSVTHVGFSNGYGVSLVGVYPGLSKGKTVKLKLRFYKVIRGTPYYKVFVIYSGTPAELEELHESEESDLP